MKAMKRILALFFMAICASAVAAPKADLWAKWEAHNPESAAAVSHDSWDMFLSRNVSQKGGIALVNYGAVSGDDKRLLAEYLQALSQTEVSALNKKEQLAFWINFYNALTVKTVLDNYPVDSIKSISSGFLPTGPWDDKLAEVEGEEISLNDIEHRILRPLWQDARCTTRSIARPLAVRIWRRAPSPRKTPRQCWMPPPTILLIIREARKCAMENFMCPAFTTGLPRILAAMTRRLSRT